MTIPMRTTSHGRRLIMEREGERLVAYPDPATGGSPWTIGVGHTGLLPNGMPVKRGSRITVQECDALLTADLGVFEAALNKVLTRQPADHQFDAFASVTFNVGLIFTHSTAIRRFNASATDESVVEAILMWNRPPMIVNRRRSEAAQFATPYPPGV